MIFGFSILWILGFVTTYQVLEINAGDLAPVLLWVGDGENSSPEPIKPFEKIPQADFEKILNEKLEKSMPPLLVFVMDSFCIEDFMQNKEHMKKLKNAGMIYMPAVESPMSAFKNLPMYNWTVEDDVESIADNQLAIIPTTDLNTIPKFYNEIRESSPHLIAALTGESCMFSASERVRRADEAESQAPENKSVPLLFNHTSPDVLLYSSQFPFIRVKSADKPTYEQLGTSLSDASDAKFLNDTMTVTLTFNMPHHLKAVTKFIFQYIRGYWNLHHVEYTHTNYTVNWLNTWKNVSIPRNFSYHCGQDIIFSNNDFDLNFTGWQIQFDANGTFSEAYDCIGFTSIPIWTGIFCTAILALIMIWGLIMIMDIRTMDRFDDPKGKTITINAQE